MGDYEKTMSMSAVSVIIPVFNASKYIEECARSLFSQTLSDIEYIFVDDCTPDDSITKLNSVIKDYPQRESAVKIIHLEQNYGSAKARWIGLKEATGEYIIFCDSDDILELFAYEHMYNEAKRYDADCVRCEYYKLNGNQIIKSPVLTSINAGENCRDTLFDCSIRNKILQSLWLHMVKSSVYHNELIFPVNNQGEDLCMMTQLIYYSKLVVYLKEHLYYWRFNPDSITNGKTTEKSFERFRESNANVNLIIEFLKSKGIEKKYSKHLVELKRYSKSILSEAMKLGVGLQEWKHTFSEINNIVYFNPYVSFRHKVQFFVTILRCDIPLVERIYQLLTGHKRRAGLK